MLRSRRPSAPASRMSQNATDRKRAATRPRVTPSLRPIEPQSDRAAPVKSGLVREGGLEPPRACAHKVLSLARLPFRHSRFRADQEARASILHGAGHPKEDGLTGGDGYFKTIPPSIWARPAKCRTCYSR